MNNSPDRTKEAAKFREELAHDPHAQRALDALAKMSDEEKSVEIPPIPDDLKGLWRDRYGEARETVTEPSFFEKLKTRWSSFALGGVAATSLAAIAFLFVINQNTTAPTPDQAVTMRGGGDFQPSKDCLLYTSPSPRD